MDTTKILETLKLVRENSKKRKFAQSVDLIINLKNLNLKKPEENINTFIELPHEKGKQGKIAALVGKELINKAKESCDITIINDDFPEYGRDPKKVKKIAKEAEFFIAQANLMPEIAKAFGKVLGPLGKMPNPKAGAVVPPIIPDLKPIVAKLKKTVKLQTKNDQAVRCIVGKENMKDEEIIENITAVCNVIVHSVKDEKHNIKNTIIKFSMGKPFVVGEKPAQKELKKEEQAPKTEEKVEKK